MSLPQIQLLAAARRKSLRIPYAARRVDRAGLATLIEGDTAPQPGDVALMRVEELGQHQQLELSSGRKARLFEGDEIVLVYGNRYAPDQFEARVPEHLDGCHMVAAGGIAAQMNSKHTRMRTATRVTPLGLLGDRHGRVINVARFALAPSGTLNRLPPVIAVLGTSMNAGKTETATQLIKGLSRAGLRVGAAKVTGTGAGGDTGNMRDAGALKVLDFVDAGLATTYLVEPHRVEACFELLVQTLARHGAQAIVVEVADGLYQRETESLVRSDVFRNAVSRVIFAAGDAMGSVAGVSALRSIGLPVHAASGLVTASPLASEEAQRGHGLPMLGLQELSSADVVNLLGLSAAPAAQAVA